MELINKKKKERGSNVYENASYESNEQKNVYETITQQGKTPIIANPQTNNGNSSTPPIPTKAKNKFGNTVLAFSNRKLCVVSTIVAFIVALAIGMGIGYSFPHDGTSAQIQAITATEKPKKEEEHKQIDLPTGSQYILCSNYYSGVYLYVTPHVDDKSNTSLKTTFHGTRLDINMESSFISKETPQLYTSLYKAFGYSSPVAYLLRSPFSEFYFNNSVSLISSVRDRFTLIPRQHVGNHYMFATIESKMKYSNRIQIHIATFENETEVTFLTKNSRLAQILKNNITLPPWTCKRYLGSNVYDLSGLEVKSDNSISIYLYQYIVLKIKDKPSTLFGYSYTNNQLLPVNKLAKQFLIPVFKGIYGSYATYTKIVSISRNNTIFITSGNDMTTLKYTTKTLQHGDSYEISESVLPHSIKCSLSCSVVTYLQYVYNSTNHTAPAMSIVPDLTLFHTGTRIINPGINRLVNSYPDVSLAIITTDSGITDLLLDGQPVQTQWLSFPKTSFIYTSINEVNRTKTLMFESKTAPYMIYSFGGRANNIGVGFAFPFL